MTPREGLPITLAQLRAEFETVCSPFMHRLSVLGDDAAQFGFCLRFTLDSHPGFEFRYAECRTLPTRWGMCTPGGFA